MLAAARQCAQPEDNARGRKQVPAAGKTTLRWAERSNLVAIKPDVKPGRPTNPPGGVREAYKRKGEEYRLFWPERPEFVRAAARFGATIVPFAAVGAEDGVQLVVRAAAPVPPRSHGGPTEVPRRFHLSHGGPTEVAPSR